MTAHPARTWCLGLGGSARARWDDASAVADWVDSLPAQAWQSLRGAYRACRHSTKHRERRAQVRVRELGIWQFEGSEEDVEAVLEEWHNGLKEDWSVFIGLAPRRMKVPLAMLQVRFPDTTPWEAIEQLTLLSSAATEQPIIENGGTP